MQNYGSNRDSNYIMQSHSLQRSLSSNSSRRPPLLRTQSGGDAQNDALNAKSQHTASSNNSSNSGSVGSISDSRKGSTRHRSLSQVLANNLVNTSQYLSQERTYLKRIRNQYGDDYYTKGIGGTTGEHRDSTASRMSLGSSNEDDDDEELSNYGNSELLSDLDNEDYQFDFNLASDIMKSSNSKLSIDDNLTTISRDNVKDPAVLERLDWQAMLLSVLTGDVVRSEKTKMIDTSASSVGPEAFLRSSYRDSLWFGIRAKLLNRTEDDERKITLYRRNTFDKLIEEIMNYEVSYDATANSPREQVADVLNRFGKGCELWPTLDEMRLDKPACKSPEFSNRIDALTSWLTITDAITQLSSSFKAWIGNDDLDVTRGPSDMEPPADSDLSSSKQSEVKKIFEEDSKSLAERIVKEKDVSKTFKKRVFVPIAPLLVKSKKNYIALSATFEALKLPDYINDIIQLCLVPMRLITEIIKIRIRYAKKLQNPTLMMIDQMIDDFTAYIAIAMEIKGGIIEYCRPDNDKAWYIQDMFEDDIQVFDGVVSQCVRYYLTLLNRKLNDSSKSPYLFRTNKEPDELENAFYFLRNLGEFIDGGGLVVAESITIINTRLCYKLLSYLNHQVNEPPSSTIEEMNRWYTSSLENFGQMRRKLARFTNQMSQKLTNAYSFEVVSKPNSYNKGFLDILKDTDHFLVYNDCSETQGMYFFASPDLWENESKITAIINGSNIGRDRGEDLSQFARMILASENVTTTYPSLEEGMDAKYDYSYVIAYCPQKPIVWNGARITLQIKGIPITDLKPGELLLVSNQSSYNLFFVRDRFLELLAGVSIDEALKPIEQRSSHSKLHEELRKTNKIFFRMILAIFDSVTIVTAKCRKLFPEGGYQDLVNSFFIQARNLGKSSVRWSDSGRKKIVIMRLIRLAIDWVSFICDDCVPTERKTFRCCVLALEFAMEMTRGFNILVLGENQFYKLKLKVARCMSLLISHFDIMGARSSDAEQRRLLKWYSLKQGIEKSASDDEILSAYRADLMAQIDEIEAYRSDVQEEMNSIGRVLDISDSEYHFVTLLASSFSSVSIRWQKGKFIGGGSFGQVFAAVNLDTGGVMAVKEIVFHDSQSLKLIPSIKEEMTVLEMLNHPNVVQYFGVEVHRDKVYIFMEFCEGGSLSGLLAHGRIEDEMVIQVYTLQMLEGLAYLHQSGVVHRDIKPENILLDHNGVIKFVDFGAAKVIAASGKTRTVAGQPSRKQNNGGANNPQNLNSMTGTPMYMSPEVITGQSSSKSGVVDIWSLGCCVLEMATGRRPWANLDNEWAIMYHIAAGHKPQLPSADQLSEAGIRFLSRCLEHDPSKRASATELLEDPWIIQIRQVAFGSSESGNTPVSENKFEL